MLTERIKSLMTRPDSGRFEELIGEAAEAEGETSTWEEIPTAAPSEEFPADSELYRVAVTATLPTGFLARPGGQPILALSSAGGSSLIDELVTAHGAVESARPIGPRGVEAARARSWLAARQRDRRAAAIVGSEDRLEQLLAPLARRGLRFRLPSGSSVTAVADSGSPSSDLATRLCAILGLPPERLLVALEAPGVATPFFARWSESPKFEAPPWTRVATVDGELIVFDLANLGRPLKVATGVAAAVAGSTFRLGPR